MLKIFKNKENKENRKKTIFKNYYRESMINYIDTLREKNIKIKKISISYNELNELDIEITGEEEK